MTWREWIGRRRLLLALAAAAGSITCIWFVSEPAAIFAVAIVSVGLIALAESRLYRRRSASKRKE